MLIVKLMPICLETSGFLLISIVLWGLCRLCTTMKTLCDVEPCRCDNVGRINCVCQKEGVQELEISRDGVNHIISTASYLTVKDCAAVRIRRKSFETLQSLVRINLANIANLTLEEHSFSWNDSAIHETYPSSGLEIRVENVTVSQLPTFVFRGRIDAITFVRVTIDAVRAYAFTSLAGTRNLAFHECSFGAFESQAFKNFAVHDTFTMVGGRVRDVVPSRTLLDVAVHNALRFSGVQFERRVHSAAFRVHGPRLFQLHECRFARLDGEAFKVHTRGPVFVDDNIFGAVETGAFAGLGVERQVLDLNGRQEFVFENNTVDECARDAFLFNATVFAPKLDWIRMEARCECRMLRHWLRDVVVYSLQRGDRRTYERTSPPPDVHLDEIVSCRIDENELQPVSLQLQQQQEQLQQRQYMRLKDYSFEYCGEQAPSMRLVAIAGTMAALVLVALAVAYWIWYKSGRRGGTRWLNVPQSSPTHETATNTTATYTTSSTLHHHDSSDPSTTADTVVEQPSPCYEEPSTSRRHIIFVDNDYRYDEPRGRLQLQQPQSQQQQQYFKETELRVIAENPERSRHLYANRMHDYGSSNVAHEYSNPYAELNREYKYHRVGKHRQQQLLTSDL